MKKMRWPSLLLFLLCPLPARADAPALTIYNRDFAVVRERIPLDLRPGVNAVSFAGATVHLEPDSVVLRDPAGRVRLQVLEQSFRADTISQALLLYLNEGKEIDFQRRRADGGVEIVRGTVVRSGYVPNTAGMSRYGQQFAQRQQAMASWQGSGSPIVRVDGKLQFQLPGEPLFPDLGTDAILYPTLSWQVASDRAARLDAELSYVTGGMRWEAAYNLVAPEKGDVLDIVGWVTLDNQSGKTFENASIKLMAGDVSKIQWQPPLGYRAAAMATAEQAVMGPPVTEKAFDEFHLYTLARPATLRNRETKQVEFLRGERVAAPTIYVYNGAAVDWRRYSGWSPEQLRNDREYGTRSNPKVWVMREIANTKENGLGLPLPAGRTRFYRRDDDGRLEFTGENTIDHTPRGETLRIYTGDAFDVVGERKRTDYRLDNAGSQLEEAFEIRIRNRKTEPVQVRVAERLYRWLNWQIVEKSDPFEKTDAQSVEFVVAVAPDQEKVLTYRVRYDWR